MAGNRQRCQWRATGGWRTSGDAGGGQRPAATRVAGLRVGGPPDTRGFLFTFLGEKRAVLSARPGAACCDWFSRARCTDLFFRWSHRATGLARAVSTAGMCCRTRNYFIIIALRKISAFSVFALREVPRFGWLGNDPRSRALFCFFFSGFLNFFVFCLSKRTTKRKESR